MGFLYVEMDLAKEKIRNNFNNVKKRMVNNVVERRCCEDAKKSRKDMLPVEWWNFYGDMTPELKSFSILNVELDDVIDNNVVEVDVVVTNIVQSGGGGNFELGGSGTSRNPTLVNNEDGVLSEIEFDDDTQDTDEDDGFLDNEHVNGQFEADPVRDLYCKSKDSMVGKWVMRLLGYEAKQKTNRHLDIML
ncbi:hypothetical protein KIW84_070601 [Lathyrus oleraceus]|uniref:Uncharacterized protein n=1 Tax=Pisum sativum TaxID=3888 RepID=A0A9D4VH69_PEA|nr:hypothetical protein KIW84_070601 [Pisum sativum]